MVERKQGEDVHGFHFCGQIVTEIFISSFTQILCYSFKTSIRNIFFSRRTTRSRSGVRTEQSEDIVEQSKLSIQDFYKTRCGRMCKASIDGSQ